MPHSLQPQYQFSWEIVWQSYYTSVIVNLQVVKNIKNIFQFKTILCINHRRFNDVALCNNNIGEDNKIGILYLYTNTRTISLR